MTQSGSTQASRQERIENLLDGFFAPPGNDFSRAAIASRPEPIAACARVWTEELKRPTEDEQLRPVLLPRKRSGPPTWYGVAFNGAQGRDLREQITAFAGPTLSTFRGQGYTLDADDSIEATIAQAQPAFVAHFEGGATPDARTQLTNALALMAKVRSGVQVRQSELLLSTGQVLRRFYMSLAARNRSEAEEELLYLRRHNLLDALNVQFLEVQLRAELGLWREIIDLPLWPQLVQTRRPLAVTRALLRALYNVYLAPWEGEGDAQSLQQAFRDEVWPQRGSLLSARAGMATPEVLKLFLLRALHSNDLSLRDDLVASFDGAEPALTSQEQSFWLGLAVQLPPTATPVVENPLAEAQAAVNAGDFDCAFILTQSAPASVPRAIILLRCAYELETPDIEQAAVQAIQALAPEEREQLLRAKLNRSFWEALTGGTSEVAPVPPSIPTSWSEWLEAARRCDRSDAWIELQAIKGADAWPLEPLQDASEVENLSDKLDATTKTGAALQRLMNVMPHILRYFERDEAFPQPHLRDVYTHLRSLLAIYGSTGTKSEWEVYAEWCRVALELGLTTAAYNDLLDETEHLCKDRLAPSNLDVALELLDYLFVYPCHNNARRSVLAQTVLSRAALWISGGHLDLETWRFCRQLAGDFVLSELFIGIDYPSSEVDEGHASPTVDPLTQLADKSVALYTLTETAAGRARDIIQKRCPSCQVTLNHDKTGTTALQHLAQGADVFVMVTASAKHAATDFIEAHRSDKSTLLRVNAKGSSSILRALSTMSMAT